MVMSAAGLSMDYHVFVVSRIRELALRGLPTREAAWSLELQGAGAAAPAHADQER